MIAVMLCKSALSAAEETKDREWRTFQANAGATIKLLKGLTFRNTTGMRYQTRRNDIFTVISP